MTSLLFILISFIAITSTLSGLLMISSPDGGILNLPLVLLNGTPFKNFLIPGILLTTIVGLVNLLAVFYNMKRHHKCISIPACSDCAGVKHQTEINSPTLNYIQ